MTRIITVTSGKGGVGKTNLSANLSAQLAALGYRTCIFDADLGLANINILFGFYPDKTIEDVILGDVPLSHIIKNHHGIDIIPGSSGVEKIANIEPERIDKLLQSFSILDTYDFLLFDTSAGVSKNVVSFCLASSEIILIITPEPTSLTDAYALLKILCANGLSSPVRVIVNHSKDTNAARQTYGRFKEVTKKYLSIEIQPLGFLIEDPKITSAVKRQQPFISLYPDTIAAKCIKAIAQNLLQQKPESFESRPAESFWKQFVTLFTGPLNLKGEQEQHKAKKPDIRPEKQEIPLPATAAYAPETADRKQFRDREAPPDRGYAVQHPVSEKPPEPVVTTASPEPALIVESGATAQPIQPAPPEQQLPGHEATPGTDAVPARDSSSAILPYPLDQNMYSLLNKLVNGISTISEEFKQVRKNMEGNGKLTGFSGGKSAETPAQQKRIILDFETYVEHHTGKK